MPIRPEMKARYPKDWKLRSHFIRFVRAKGQCEKCGAKHGDMIRCCQEPLFGDNGRCASCGKRIRYVVLTTAHVYDHRPEAASFLNLAAWCQKCHNRHDAKARRRGTIARKFKNQMELAI